MCQEENQVFRIISGSRQAPQSGKRVCGYFVRRQVGDRWKQPAIISSSLRLSLRAVTMFRNREHQPGAFLLRSPLNTNNERGVPIEAPHGKEHARRSVLVLGLRHQHAYTRTSAPPIIIYRTELVFRSKAPHAKQYARRSMSLISDTSPDRE